MPLKRFVSKIEDVPEAQRGLYVKKDDGSYALDAEDEDWSKLDEFRSNNRKMKGDLDKAKTDLDKYKDIDPARYTEMSKTVAMLEKLEDAQLLKDGKFDEVVKKRTTAMQQQYETQVTAKDKRIKELEDANGSQLKRLTRLRLESEALAGVESAGSLKPNSRGIILRMAEDVFKDVDGTLKAFGPDGQELYNEKTEPFTPGDWGKKLLADHPYLFEPSKGGGAKGGQREVTQPGAKTMAYDGGAASQVDFARNAEKIAKGEMKVVSDSK